MIVGHPARQHVDATTRWVSLRSTHPTGWPYGEVRSITGSASNNLRFPGQYFLVESGLHYNWHRQYDPTLGRYMQADPLGFVDGPSVYAYAGSAPTMNVDPLGLAELYRSENGVTFHAYPGPPSGGNEHALYGEGEAYHIHVRDKDGNDARIATKTWEPLTTEDENIYRRSTQMQNACEKLSPGEKEFIHRVNKRVFHRGYPTAQQLERLGWMRGGRFRGGGRSGGEE